MNENGNRKGPVIFEYDRPSDHSPATAPLVEDAVPDVPPMARMVAGRGWRLGGFFLASLGSLVTFLATLAAWTYVTNLLAAHPLLGWIAAALIGAFLLATLLISLRELAAFARLSRLDRIRRDATTAQATNDAAQAHRVTAHLVALYRGRPEVAWAAARLQDRLADATEADSILTLTEGELMSPLDQAARREVEASARQVAAVTAIVPLALADVATALLVNVRMVRRIAQIYGGRGGALGSLRILRSVMTHLVATGAVAIGDDLIHSVAGGGLLAKLSRRFGEGVINGALTARVGIAAMEVCRPLPFDLLPRPKVTNLVTRGLSGLFAKTPEV